MRKSIIKIVSICLVLLISFALFALPIFNIDTNYLEEKYQDKIIDIKENYDPYADISHVFTKETFDKANGNKIELDEDVKASFEVTYTGTYEDTPEGVKLDKSFKLETTDVSNFFRLSIWAAGEGTKIIVSVNDKEIETVELTKEMTKYVIDTEMTESANLEIYFTSASTLHRIKINELIPASEEEAYENAKGTLVSRIILFAGLINNHPNNIDVENKDIAVTDVEFGNILDGVDFFNLFNMAIRDIRYDFSVIKEIFEVNKEVDLPFSASFEYYQEMRFCPFVSILVFISGLAILGSLGYIVVSFVIDLILKKEKTNMLIASFIALGGMMVILNISTFFGPSFFNDTHNIATEYRIFFFEIASATPSLYTAVALIAGLAIVNYVDIVVEYINPNTFTALKQGRTKFVVFTALLVVMIILVVLGLIIR